MDLFGTKELDGYTIIVGCGRLGAILASKLSDSGEEVLIIDKYKDAFTKLSPSYGGIATLGDATEINVLQDAKIEKATALIAVTDNDNTNIMVAQLAKEIFHVDYVVSRLYDYERECVYQEFDIDTICPSTLSANEIVRILSVSKESNKK